MYKVDVYYKEIKNGVHYVHHSKKEFSSMEECMKHLDEFNNIIRANIQFEK